MTDLFYPEHTTVFSELLREAAGKTIVVIGHIRPDGDCIGSQLALTRILRQQGIDAQAVNQHPIPRNMVNFCADTPFQTAAVFLQERHGTPSILVDCASRGRIGDPLAAHFTEHFGNIDHHISNRGFARFDIVNARSSSTSGLLAGMVFDLGLPLDAVTAQALYLGIVADTGQFRYRSDDPALFEICARLVHAGANPAEAARHLFEEEPWSKIELMRCFLGSLRLESRGRVCIGTLRLEDFQSCRANREDAEGLIDIARDIAGVEIAVLLEHRNDGPGTKGSLRAVDERLRVDRIATRFGGGGHACAAGFLSDLPMEELCDELLESIEALYSKTPVSANPIP